MASKGTIVIISTTIFVIILVAVFAFAFHQTIPNEQSNWSGPPEQQTPQITYKPVLNVNGKENSGYWSRNIATDLPEYISMIVCEVSNNGNMDAKDVNVEIRIDGALWATEYIPVLSVWDTKTYSYSISIPYDSSHSISIRATCSESSDSHSFSIEHSLPRYDLCAEPELAKLFVTPREQSVVRLENEILKDKLIITPNWIALRDWVGKNIKYPEDDFNGDGKPDYDYIKHGARDYWQLPKETLGLRTGDCEDYAILLVSLLRVSGYSADDVFVVIGKNDNNEYHAWVKINLGILGWYNLEPQGDGWATLIGDFISLSGYQAIYQFNDSQFKKLT